MSPLLRRHVRRLTAAAVVGTSAVLALASPAAAAGPGTAAAATWLTGALTDGDHLFYGDPNGDPNFNYPIDGPSADAVFALTASGTHDDTVAAIDAYLQTRVASYADPDGTGEYPGPYSGGLAKLSLVAETTRQDPHAYGGFDLLKVLTDNQCTAANAEGTCNAPGEFYQAYTTISQALGVIALQRSPLAVDHLTATSPAVTRLLALQCTDGLFTGTLLAPGATCATGDVDSSAYAVQAIAAVLGSDDAVVTTTLDAVAAAQDTSGGYSGAAGINGNTTGLALSAFSLQPGTRTANVTAAAAFVGTLQRTDGAYQVSATDDRDDSAKVATPQVLLGALNRNLADPALVTAAPVTPVPTPTTGAPTSGATSPAATGSAPELAATGAADGHLPEQLLVALVALAGGAGLVRFGVRRLPSARHRA